MIVIVIAIVYTYTLLRFAVVQIQHYYYVYVMEIQTYTHMHMRWDTYTVLHLYNTRAYRRIRIAFNKTHARTQRWWWCEYVHVRAYAVWVYVCIAPMLTLSPFSSSSNKWDSMHKCSIKSVFSCDVLYVNMRMYWYISRSLSLALTCSFFLSLVAAVYRWMYTLYAFIIVYLAAAVCIELEFWNTQSIVYSMVYIHTLFMA